MGRLFIDDVEKVVGDYIKTWPPMLNALTGNPGALDDVEPARVREIIEARVRLLGAAWELQRLVDADVAVRHDHQWL